MNEYRTSGTSPVPVYPPRGAPKDPNDPTLGRWGEELPFAIEDRGTLADLEADSAYRWAAGAAAGRRVLDLGCGPGHGAAALAVDAASVLGVDSRLAEIEAAEALYSPTIEVLRSELSSIPLHDDAFELVVHLGLAEATDPGASLDECRRLLAPGGLLIASLGHPDAENDLDGLISQRFTGVARYRGHSMLGATISPDAASGDPVVPIVDARWLTPDPGELLRVLAVAGDGELPELRPVASLADFRDLREFRRLLEAWEQRARQAEAEGSAKHWELVAAREAQRRLRRRLFELEHRPLRTLLRMLKGGPRKVGPGPPIRASERGPETWD